MFKKKDGTKVTKHDIEESWNKEMKSFGGLPIKKMPEVSDSWPSQAGDTYGRFKKTRISARSKRALEVGLKKRIPTQFKH